MITQVVDLNVTLREAAEKEGRKTLVARIFGKVVGPAVSKIEYYHSDLARDTMWLLDHTDELLSEQHFWWSFRQCGTSIGFDRDDVRALGGTAFRCQVRIVDKYGDKILDLVVHEES